VSLPQSYLAGCVIDESIAELGDPVDDLAVATVLMMVGGQLVLLRPRKVWCLALNFFCRLTNVLRIYSRELEKSSTTSRYLRIALNSAGYTFVVLAPWKIRSGDTTVKG
jgi:hypothetical protein